MLFNQGQLVYQFNRDSSRSDWFIVNDGVMGGKSKGNFEINPEGHGRFSGFISLENNGGFSMMVHRMKTVEVSPEKSVVLKLKGDGKSYQLRVKDRSNHYYSYARKFKTSGEWEEVRIPLSELRPTFRGQAVDRPSFDQNTLEEVALLIGNKKEEDFELLLEAINIK
jgi:hypothetical protein